MKKSYQEKLYDLSGHLLPAIVATHSDLSESEMVDMAVAMAQSLLSELGYTPHAKRRKASK